MTGADRVMLVTGGGTGIGAAVAERAVRDGWRVVVCGRRPDPLDRVAARTGARPVVCDVRDADAVQALVDGTVAAFGRLDCVVANAGVMHNGTLQDVTPAEWDHVLRANLTSAYLLTRAALPHLLAARGSVVAVSSIAALRASAGALTYAVSKAGLVVLAQSVARDFAAQGVRANVVCPGWVGTEMADQEMAEFGAPLGLPGRRRTRR